MGLLADLALGRSDHPAGEKVGRGAGAGAEDVGRYWRFGLTYPGEVEQEVRTLPEATLAQANILWPGAVIRPLDEQSEVL